MENRRLTPLEYVFVEDIEKDPSIRVKALYLYWGCFRGHSNLVDFILSNDKISPFARVYEGRSPLMASLIGKQKEGLDISHIPYHFRKIAEKISNRSQLCIVSREYTYEKDQDSLDMQMLETDNFGNNPLHFAFRSKKPVTIELVIRAGYGEIDSRN